MCGMISALWRTPSLSCTYTIAHPIRPALAITILRLGTTSCTLTLTLALTSSLLVCLLSCCTCGGLDSSTSSRWWLPPVAIFIWIVSPKVLWSGLLLLSSLPFPFLSLSNLFSHPQFLSTPLCSPENCLPSFLVG